MGGVPSPLLLSVAKNPQLHIWISPWAWESLGGALVLSVGRLCRLPASANVPRCGLGSSPTHFPTALPQRPPTTASPWLFSSKGLQGWQDGDTENHVLGPLHCHSACLLRLSLRASRHTSMAVPPPCLLCPLCLLCALLSTPSELSCAGSAGEPLSSPPQQHPAQPQNQHFPGKLSGWSGSAAPCRCHRSCLLPYQQYPGQDGCHHSHHSDEGDE